MSAMSWKKRASFFVATPVAFGLGAVTMMGARGNLAGAQNAKPPVQPSAQALELQNAFEKVAESIRPSVVYIRSRQTARTAQDDGASPFEFSFPGAPNQRGFRAPRPRAYSSGSGVIVRGDGYILTNDHVVQGADKVIVRLQDGREFTGDVKRDFKSDLAVVKVNATGLPYVQISDSDKVKIGQWAVAFGSPFGLNDTMTVGIVSSLHRNQQIGAGSNQRYYPSLIQTDASINPGNSGGPLIDLYGRLIGINVAIESPTGGNVGIGFAIPANAAKFVMEQLITKGAVTRGFLGLAPRSLSFDEQKRYNTKEGVLVASVQDGTPAAKAGFQVEDVIVRFNNKPIANEAEFRDVVARTAPGSTVSVTVKRGAGEQTLKVTIGTLDEPKVAKADAPAKGAAQGKLGVVVGNANDPQVRQELRLEGAGKPGAMIVEVVPGSPASEAGLLPGDIIVKVDGKAVGNADDATNAIKSLGSGREVSLVIRRRDQQLLTTVELE